MLGKNAKIIFLIQKTKIFIPKKIEEIMPILWADLDIMVSRSDLSISLVSQSGVAFIPLVAVKCRHMIT